MAPVLIDSDILIEVSRGRYTVVVTHWEALAESDAVILYSPVTMAEIWHGARPREESLIEALFGALVCVPVDAAVGRRAGQYLRRYAKSHSLELGDALIAASAVVHHAELWTRNRKHYPMKEVSLYQPGRAR